MDSLDSTLYLSFSKVSLGHWAAVFYYTFLFGGIPSREYSQLASLSPGYLLGVSHICFDISNIIQWLCCWRLDSASRPAMPTVPSFAQFRSTGEPLHMNCRNMVPAKVEAKTLG